MTNISSEYKLAIDGKTIVTVKADHEISAGEALLQMIDGLMPYVGWMENAQAEEPEAE
jgi:hypothetical protein